MRNSLAFVLVILSAAAQAQQLGTLFHSPKERETLERLRRGESPEQAAVAIRPDPVVTGYVKRSDGKSTVFLDKRPYRARSGRMQGLLEPRIVERYEPIPLPPEPAASVDDEEGNTVRKPALPKKVPTVQPKRSKED